MVIISWCCEKLKILLLLLLLLAFAEVGDNKVYRRDEYSQFGNYRKPLNLYACVVLIHICAQTDD